MNKRRLRIVTFACLALILPISKIEARGEKYGTQIEHAIKLSKSASPSEFTHIGEQITYTFVVTNSLNNSIFNIMVHDDLVDVACPKSSLKPGVSCFGAPRDSEMACTGVYTITEADIAARKVVNEASVTAKYHEAGCQSGKLLTASASDNLTIKYNPPLEITLRKTGSPTTYNGPGQEIGYKYKITNTGTDPVPGPILVNDDKCRPVTCPPGGLDPGESLTCTGTYISTEADFLAGAITNQAEASANIPGGLTITVHDSFVVELVVDPSLTIQKSADPTTFSKADELIKFTFVVGNSGDVVIESPIEVLESLPLSNFDCTKTQTELAPGEQFICEGWYAVTAADIGQNIKNCATAKGSFSGQEVVSNESCIEIYYLAPRDRGDDPSCDDNPPPPGC